MKGLHHKSWKPETPKSNRKLVLGIPSVSSGFSERIEDEELKTNREWEGHLNQIITLNVGGTMYQTRLKTLLRFQRDGDYFRSRFSGNFKNDMEEDGSYFIDRSGQLFEYILHYLQNNDLPIPTDDFLKNRLVTEAKFYGLNRLVAILKPPEPSGEVFNKNRFFPEGRYEIKEQGKLLQLNTINMRQEWPSWDQIETFEIHRSGKPYVNFRLLSVSGKQPLNIAFGIIPVCGPQFTSLTEGVCWQGEKIKYKNTERLLPNFWDHYKKEFGTRMMVTIRLDMDNKHVRFELNGTVITSQKFDPTWTAVSFAIMVRNISYMRLCIE